MKFYALSFFLQRTFLGTVIRFKLLLNQSSSNQNTLYINICTIACLISYLYRINIKLCWHVFFIVILVVFVESIVTQIILFILSVLFICCYWKMCSNQLLMRLLLGPKCIFDLFQYSLDSAGIVFAPVAV